MKHYFLLIVGLLCAVSCGSGNTNAEQASGAYHRIIDLDTEALGSNKRDTINLGNLRQGENIQYNFGIKNTDTVALIILDVFTGCGCTQVEYDKQPILPGKTGGIQLTYDSKGQFGFQYKHILVKTSLHQKELSVFLLADVRN